MSIISSVRCAGWGTAALCGAILWLLLTPQIARADLTTPLSVSNQSPLIQIFGLPDMSRSTLLAAGEIETRVTLDIASHFIQEQTSRELLELDGESYRYTLKLSYGFNDRLEFGLELPYVVHRAGWLDGFINDWHKFFGLPTSGRESVANDRLSFFYGKDGQALLNVTESQQDFGDLRLRAAWQLTAGGREDSLAVALHGSLKLPTGDSDKLTGSGGTDLALWVSAGREKRVAWGDLGLMTSLGVLLLEDGEVLEDQQRNLVGFGGVGLALQPWRHVRFNLQTDFHTSFYDDSRMRAVDSPSIQLAMGGSIILSRGHEIELAVIEDVYVDTAPDVVFHFGWHKRF